MVGQKGHVVAPPGKNRDGPIILCCLVSRRFRILSAFILLIGYLAFRGALNKTTTTEHPAPTSLEMKRTSTASSNKSLESTTSTSAAADYSKCSSIMGQRRFTKKQAQMAANLPKNVRAHLFTFPDTVRDTKKQYPLLCVPQKNGNKEFAELVYVAWRDKPPKTWEEADKDMHRREVHEAEHKRSHVYFVTRNPYTRILSLYLQKVANSCLPGAEGCKSGWRGFHKRTTFKAFVEGIEQRATSKGSLCAVNAHLCQQVESCITTTLDVKEVTAIRLEEQSKWFPCFIQEIGIKPALLETGWENLKNNQSCYYTSTGDCKDMLQSIDPGQVNVTTGSFHATGASSAAKLREHYDSETAEIVSRLYADDFRILGYPLWNEEIL